MKANDIPGVRKAAQRLGVGYDVLKSIMSDHGKPRYSAETLSSVLKRTMPTAVAVLENPSSPDRQSTSGHWDNQSTFGTLPRIERAFSH